MEGFLSSERLKSFSDSVLIVAMVLLVYNLATLAGSEPRFFEPGIFTNALIAYISSFIVVFYYWSRFTLLLDHIDTLDDTSILVALAFLILVTLTPVSYIGLLQLKSHPALIFACVNQILAGSALMLLLGITTRKKTMGSKARYFFFQISIIPLVYLTSLLLSYLSLTGATVFPLSIIPIFL